MAAARWPVRTVPSELRARYLAEGWWTDDTLGGLVERSLRDAPNAEVHIWSETRPWHGTYADIEADARRLVTVLREGGIEPGDVVAFQLPNWREALVAFYGLALGGYVLVPIVHIYGPKEVRFILAQCGARAYISADRFGHVDYVDIVENAPAGSLPALSKHLVVDSDDWRAIANATPLDAAVATDPEEVCVLAYTSGTTSDPKGVMHTHRTLLAEMQHMAPMLAAAKDNLMGSPVTHATGMLGAALGPMQLGRNINLIDRWDPDRVLDIMIEARIGAGTGASVFLASVIDHPKFTPEHARLVPRVGLGGAPVPVALAERALEQGIAIIRAYGSTEHPSITGSMFDDPDQKRNETDGCPRLGVEVQLVDGEIWSRGPDLCAGYTDTALTAKVFDADGWYHTGDMGVLDDEGYLTITDRLNDVVIRGGENISAAEVEVAIAELPTVAEVAVVAAPDTRLGEHACALVRLTPGATELKLGDVTAHLEHIGLARQKWPEDLRIVPDFPRTASGKIRKVDLRAQLRAETA